MDFNCLRLWLYPKPQEESREDKFNRSAVSISLHSAHGFPGGSCGVRHVGRGSVAVVRVFILSGLPRIIQDWLKKKWGLRSWEHLSVLLSHPSDERICMYKDSLPQGSSPALGLCWGTPVHNYRSQ